jgi:hypothetical protein
MKTFIFTTAINGCQSLSGLHTTIVNVKKLVNPDRGLSTQNRPEKSKCVEVIRQGSFVLKCFYSLINPVCIISVIRAATLKIVYKTGSLVVDADLDATKQDGATSFLKPSDTMNDRQPIGLKWNNSLISIFTMGVRGKLLFLRFSISFSPAGRLSFNSLIS